MDVAPVEPLRARSDLSLSDQRTYSSCCSRRRGVSGFAARARCSHYVHQIVNTNHVDAVCVALQCARRSSGSKSSLNAVVPSIPGMLPMEPCLSPNHNVFVRRTHHQLAVTTRKGQLTSWPNRVVSCSSTLNLMGPFKVTFGYLHDSLMSRPRIPGL